MLFYVSDIRLYTEMFVYQNRWPHNIFTWGRSPLHRTLYSSDHEATHSAMKYFPYKKSGLSQVVQFSCILLSVNLKFNLIRRMAFQALVGVAL
jgi:hypothetical protein